jgi:hypothetical protein
MREKVALNEAGCRVGTSLALMGINRRPVSQERRAKGIVVLSPGKVKPIPRTFSHMAGWPLGPSRTARRRSAAGAAASSSARFFHREAVSFNLPDSDAAAPAAPMPQREVRGGRHRGQQPHIVVSTQGRHRKIKPPIATAASAEQLAAERQYLTHASHQNRA